MGNVARHVQYARLISIAQEQAKVWDPLVMMIFVKVAFLSLKNYLKQTLFLLSL